MFWSVFILGFLTLILILISRAIILIAFSDHSHCKIFDKRYGVTDCKFLALENSGSKPS